MVCVSHTFSYTFKKLKKKSEKDNCKTMYFHKVI